MKLKLTWNLHHQVELDKLLKLSVGDLTFQAQRQVIPVNSERVTERWCVCVCLGIELFAVCVVIHWAMLTDASAATGKHSKWVVWCFDALTYYHHFMVTYSRLRIGKRIRPFQLLDEIQSVNNEFLDVATVYSIFVCNIRTKTNTQQQVIQFFLSAFFPLTIFPFFFFLHWFCLC